MVTNLAPNNVEDAGLETLLSLIGLIYSIFSRKMIKKVPWFFGSLESLDFDHYQI